MMLRNACGTAVVKKAERQFIKVIDVYSLYCVTGTGAYRSILVRMNTRSAEIEEQDRVVLIRLVCH
jgi:hypothetical protein